MTTSEASELVLQLSRELREARAETVAARAEGLRAGIEHVRRLLQTVDRLREENKVLRAALAKQRGTGREVGVGYAP